MSVRSRLTEVENRNFLLEQVFGNADIRLDSYGVNLASLFGDTATEHNAGRWTSKTTVGDVYEIFVSNKPTDQSATFTPIRHAGTVRTLRVELHPELDVDFTPKDLAEVEKWVVEAHTGEVLDPNRHAKRAEAMAALLG